jgi:sortase (surface protein transpeptidase)
METPNVLDYVTGWYKYSPTPGELGPAIIVGHVDSYKGISVFWRLRELVPGDTIDITRADGSVAKFQVNSLQQFDQTNFPTQAIYGDINYAGLRLITCGGTFNRKTGHYDHNMVVFASLATD